MAGKSALAHAYRLLGQRDYSSWVLKQRLLRRFSEDEVDEAVSTLLRRGDLDDARYCRDTVLRLLRRGRGSLYVDAYLKARGVPPELRREAVAGCLGQPEREAAEAYLKKQSSRTGRSPVRALVTRGFSPEVIEEVARRYAKRTDTTEIP